MTHKSATQLLGWMQYVPMNIYYFGISFMWNSIGRFLIQAILPRPTMVGPDAVEAAMGLLNFVGLLIAAIVQPIAGAMSDRWKSRWGRRRPFMVIATLADLVFLAALAFAPNYWFLMLAYCLLQFTSNVAHGPYQGLLADLVSEEQRGIASSIKQFIDTFGLIIVAILMSLVLANQASSLDDNLQMMFLLVAGVLVGTMVLNVVVVRESESAPQPTHPSFNVPSFISTMRMLPQATVEFMRQYPDFSWLIASRLMILGALAFISNNAQFFFQKVLFKNVPDMDQAIKFAVKMQSDLLTTAVIVTLIVTLFSGPLSDRWGRRSVNVVGGLFSAAGAWVFLSIQNATWVNLFGLPITDLLVAGGLIGIGMGLFTSANWAWAVDLTPPDQAAHFLGLTNIATAGATVVTSLFGPIISLLNMQSAGAGFTFMFTLSIIGFILGALMLFKVRDTHRV